MVAGGTTVSEPTALVSMVHTNLSFPGHVSRQCVRGIPGVLRSRPVSLLPHSAPDFRHYTSHRPDSGGRADVGLGDFHFWPTRRFDYFTIALSGDRNHAVLVLMRL